MTPPDETIRDAATVVGDWVADGTKTAEPVTTETPPAQVRNADGTFGPKVPVEAAAPSATHASEPATASATAAAASPTLAPGASAAAVQEFIEAQLGEQNEVVKIPKGVRIPLKRGETIEYATIDELQKRGMLELDYRHKTAEAAAARRVDESNRLAFAAEQARVQAREDWLNERETEMREAQKDPEKWEAYQETLRLYQSNPRFAKLMDDALAKRETDAVNKVYEERDYQLQVQEGVTVAAQWIDQVATEFPGVNPERVRVRYAEALQSGRATLDPAHVRAIYQDEARYVTETTSPLSKELADLKAQVAALTATKGAEKHNAGTSHALDRSKAPPVGTGTGSPPAPAQPKPGERFGPRELAERNQAWATQR